jgi:hypothetical protein
MLYQKIKRRIYEILDKARPGDIASHIFDISMMTLIITNILAIFIETFDISPYFKRLMERGQCLHRTFFRRVYQPFAAIPPSNRIRDYRGKIQRVQTRLQRELKIEN